MVQGPEARIRGVNSSQTYVTDSRVPTAAPPPHALLIFVSFDSLSCSYIHNQLLKYSYLTKLILTCGAESSCSLLARKEEQPGLSRLYLLGGEAPVPPGQVQCTCGTAAGHRKSRVGGPVGPECGGCSIPAAEIVGA